MSVIKSLELGMTVSFQQWQEDAKKNNKPLLILVGEHHHDLSHAVMEALLLKSARKVGIKDVGLETDELQGLDITRFLAPFIEQVPSVSGYIVPMIDVATDMNIHCMDMPEVKRDFPGQLIKEIDFGTRETYMRGKIKELNGPAICFFGGIHLPPLLEDEDIKKKFHVVGLKMGNHNYITNDPDIAKIGEERTLYLNNPTNVETTEPSDLFNQGNVWNDFEEILGASFKPYKEAFRQGGAYQKQALSNPNVRKIWEKGGLSDEEKEAQNRKYKETYGTDYSLHGKKGQTPDKPDAVNALRGLVPSKESAEVLDGKTSVTLTLFNQALNHLLETGWKPALENRGNIVFDESEKTIRIGKNLRNDPEYVIETILHQTLRDSYKYGEGIALHWYKTAATFLVMKDLNINVPHRTEDPYKIINAVSQAHSGITFQNYDNVIKDIGQELKKYYADPKNYQLPIASVQKQCLGGVSSRQHKNSDR